MRWNEARGFGFVLPAKGSVEVFVHASGFPQDGVRPRVGEVVSFEIETTPDGRRRAVRVWRAGSVAAQPARVSKPAARRSPWRHRFLAPLGALALLGAAAVMQWPAIRDWATDSGALEPQPPHARDAPATVISDPSSTFTCDGRTRCAQMNSCAEATYFLRHCPNTQMDGDNDGIPCERQWCAQ
ncbi:MAG: excalibur calcium-binding domain-containing protein [Rudaea sp.]